MTSQAIRSRSVAAGSTEVRAFFLVRIARVLLLCVMGCSSAMAGQPPAGFVAAHAGGFESDGAPYGFVGANLWAWGGEGAPADPGGFWQLGDDYTGDPPHEPQGWYSVHMSDHLLVTIAQYSSSLSAQLQRIGGAGCVP